MLYKRPAVLEGLQAEQEQRPAFVDLAAFMQWLWRLTVAPQHVCRGVAMQTMKHITALVHPASDAGGAFVTTSSGLRNAFSLLVWVSRSLPAFCHALKMNKTCYRWEVLFSFHRIPLKHNGT